MSRRRKDSLEDARGITVGGNRVYFNKQAIRWLSVWLDSELTLKEHHDVRTKRTETHRIGCEDLQAKWAAMMSIVCLRSQPIHKELLKLLPA